MKAYNEAITFIYDLEGIFMTDEDVREWIFNEKVSGLTWDYLDRLEYFKPAIIDRHFKIERVDDSFRLELEFELSNTTLFLERVISYKGCREQLGVSYRLLKEAESVLEKFEKIGESADLEKEDIHNQIDTVAKNIASHMKQGIYLKVQNELSEESLMKYFIKEYQANYHFREFVDRKNGIV